MAFAGIQCFWRAAALYWGRSGRRRRGRQGEDAHCALGLGGRWSRGSCCAHFMLILCSFYAHVMLMLCSCYAHVMLNLCSCYAHVMLMLCSIYAHLQVIWRLRWVKLISFVLKMISFVFKMMDRVSETRNCVLKMTDFAGGGAGRISLRGDVQHAFAR